MRANADSLFGLAQGRLFADDKPEKSVFCPIGLMGLGRSRTDASLPVARCQFGCGVEPRWVYFGGDVEGAP